MSEPGAAIGALIREAEHAETKADFIHKMSIALKEANDTQYWIELMHESGSLKSPLFASLDADVVELLKLLASITRTSRNSL